MNGVDSRKLVGLALCINIQLYYFQYKLLRNAATISFFFQTLIFYNFALQAGNFAPFLPTGGSPGGSAPEAESDEDSIADLPLNLVSTQMTETESH